MLALISGQLNDEYLMVVVRMGEAPSEIEHQVWDNYASHTSYGYYVVFIVSMSYLDIWKNVMKPETLETKVLKRIDRKRGDVFLRADFEDLGGYDQVGRVLRELVRKGRLVRVGRAGALCARPPVDDKRRPGACGRAERAEGGAPAGWRGNAAEPA